MSVLKPLGLLLASGLLLSPGLAAEPQRIGASTDVGQLPKGTSSVKVELKDVDTLSLLVTRFPRLRELEISFRTSGNKVPEDLFVQLHRFAELKSLHLVGDPRFADDHFEELGRLTTLETLQLSLP